MRVIPQEGESVTIRLTAFNVQGKIVYGVQEDGEPHGDNEQDARSALSAVTGIAKGFIADTSSSRKR